MQSSEKRAAKKLEDLQSEFQKLRIQAELARYMMAEMENEWKEHVTTDGEQIRAKVVRCRCSPSYS